MMYPGEELYILLVTVYGGILIGIIYDFYRGIRSNFYKNKILRCTEDLLFWSVVTLVGFFILHRTNSYDLRYYNFIGFILGIIIYFNTVSKYILRFFCKVIKIILTVLKGLYYIIIYPIHLIFDMILYILFKSKKNIR